MRKLTDLPEDALVAVLAASIDSTPTAIASSLRSTARALVLTGHFFADGAGALALERAGLAAVGRLLCCPPARVCEVTQCGSPMEAILFVLRSHDTAAPVACGGCHTLMLGLTPPLLTCTSNEAGQSSSETAAPAPGTPSLLSCGSNEAGQLGNGTVAIFNASISMPTTSYDMAGYTARRSLQLERNDPSRLCTVDGLEGAAVASVAAGYSHSLALAHDGRAFAWGDTGSGQCGAPPTQVTVLTPQPLLCFAGRRVAQIAAGQLHSAFLLQTGEVYCCGENSSGQLGVVDSGTMALATPRVVQLSERAVAIAAGGFHTLAIGAGVRRQVWGWGSGSAGQLGLRGIRRRASAPPVLEMGPASNAGPAVMQLPGLGPDGNPMPPFEHAAVPTLVDGGSPDDEEGHVLGSAGGAATLASGSADASGVGGSAVNTSPGGSAVNTSVPEGLGASGRVALLPPCAQLAAGLYHSLFLTVAGVAMRCGGELGPGHATTVHAPEVIAYLYLSIYIYIYI